MPVPVTLDFTPPSDPDIVALRIYESTTQNGTFVQIERTMAVNTAPDYISHYTTALATTKTDWFAIAWENAAGEVSDLSISIQGGTTTLVGEIVKRVLERNDLLDEKVVTQEAEAAIQSVLNVDPYVSAVGYDYMTLVGLTYLVLARGVIASAVIESSSGSSTVSSATLGLVSFRNEAGTASAIQKAQTDTQSLIDLANQYLGITTSFVMQLQDVMCEIGIASYDQSRLIGWISLA